jgi:hypothetical protein
MRRRDDQPEPPSGVRVIDRDGHEHACDVHFIGVNFEGVAEWAVDAPIPFEAVMSARVATLPPRTSLLFPGPIENS